MNKLIVVFYTSHADTLGNENRLNLTEYLSKKFHVIVLTNQVQLLSRRIPDAEIQEIKWPKRKLVLFKTLEFYYYLAGIVNKIPEGKVFLFHNVAPMAILINKPVYQYVYQFGKRTNVNNKSVTIKSKLKDWLYEKITIYALKRSNHIFANSRIIVDYFLNKNLKNVSFSTHGIKYQNYVSPIIENIHNKLEKKRNEGSFLITYSGWVTENRGLRLMLEAIKYLHEIDKSYVLVLCGADKEHILKIEEYKRVNDLEENILNLGYLDSILIPGILLNSDVCLSFWDKNVKGFNFAPPQKLLDYLAANKPVICTNMPSNETYIQNGLTGFLIDNEVEQLVNKVEFLRSNPEIYEKMVENCRLESLKYNSEIVYQKVFDIINET